MVLFGIEIIDMVVVIDDNNDVNEDVGDGDVVDQVSQLGILSIFLVFLFLDSFLESFESLNEGSVGKLFVNEIK